jgi:hypothetical protein
MPHLRRMDAAHGAATEFVSFTIGIHKRHSRAGRATRVAMTIQDEFANDRPRQCAPRRLAARGRCYVVLSSFALSSLAVLALVPLAGCGSDGAGAVFIDPGRYTLYHCDDLATRRKVLIARESELRGLMEKASESAAGSVIGSLAYRSEYDSVIAEQKLLQRNAAEKNCSFALPLQSDQTLR